MKVSLMRQSSLPIEISDIEAFKLEWKRLFDKAEKVCKRDMLRMNKKLQKIENLLLRKFPNISEVDFPETQDQWMSLYEKYGDIQVSKLQHENKLVLVIADSKAQMYS